LDRLTDIAKRIAPLFSYFGRSEPIADRRSLVAFVSTRAAFVAQKTLYGYVKTRMGTRYRSMFEDDVFIASLNISKMQVFAACLSDFSIYAVARALASSPPDDIVRVNLAEECFRTGLADNAEETAKADFDVAAATKEFAQRAAATNWISAANANQSFIESPRALVRWAPIADELKALDAEIVSNSIIFAWRDVRQSFAKRLKQDELIKDVLASQPAPA